MRSPRMPARSWRGGCGEVSDSEAALEEWEAQAAVAVRETCCAWPCVCSRGGLGQPRRRQLTRRSVRRCTVSRALLRRGALGPTPLRARSPHAGR